MRVMILAAAALAMTTSAAVAAPWSDPNGRLVFEAPSGWMVAPQQANGLTYAVAVGNTAECHVIAAPRPATADAPADVLRTASQTQIEPTAWTGVAAMLPNLFQGNVQVVSQAVDTRPFWAVQTADLRTADGRTVHGAIQFRPGFELWSFCQTFDGPDDVAAFDALAHSVATPNDPQIRDEVERLERQREQMARASRFDRENNMANEQMMHNQARRLPTQN